MNVENEDEQTKIKLDLEKGIEVLMVIFVRDSRGIIYLIEAKTVIFEFYYFKNSRNL